MSTVEPGASLDGERLTDLLLRLLLDADLRSRLAEEGAEAEAPYSPRPPSMPEAAP